MEIKEERAGDVLVLAPDGDLSTSEDCHALEQRLSAALSAGTRFLVLDCARVGHLTSPALRALLLASRKLGRLKGRLVLCGMAPKVQKAFSISGFDRDFTVVPAREAAITAAMQPVAATAASAPKRAPSSAPLAPASPPAPYPTAASPPEPPPAATPAVPPAVPAAPPPAPDPRLAVAARLLAALGAAPAAQPLPAPADAARLDSLAASLLRGFGVRCA